MRGWNHRWQYALYGVVLGLAAPVGALLLRLLGHGSGHLMTYVAEEWASAGYYYAYMAVGSVLVFAFFGFVLGKKGDQLEEKSRRAHLLAVTDGLTGLYNHRYLQQHLAAEFERARRYNVPFTCLMFDLDDFKRVNDSYGHPFGDDVLRVVARIIREHTRRVDIAGRYGGEEFLVLMPHTLAQEAMPVVERIRLEVQEFPFRIEAQNVHVTLSIGIATYDARLDTYANKNELLKAADDALYEAKRRGKNQAQLMPQKGAHEKVNRE